MASNGNIRSTINTRFRFAILLAGAASLAVPLNVSAQDRSAPPSLEDLIPDAAVEDPETWAGEVPGEPPAQGDAEDSSDDNPAEPGRLDPSTPMAELPDMSTAWPSDLELAPLEQLEPDADIQFAEAEVEAAPFLPDAEVEVISKELRLAFPDDADGFPERTEFVERFKALSTIEELDNGEDNIAQLSARAREDEELLGTLLRVYGYYDAQVIRTVGGIRVGADNAADGQVSVRFDILPGARYRFGVIDLGQLSTAPDAALLRETFEIQPGDMMSSDKIVQENFDLDQKLGETGYPFAEINPPELLIDHARGEGDLDLPVTPGGKYVFGEVTSSDPKFLSGRHLGSIARFDPGDVYQRSLEQDLRRAVTATGLVSSVTITPREVTPPTDGAPGTVAMDVALTPAKLRTIAGGIGYGSEEGFQVEASWEHRNFFPPEGALGIRGIVGTQEQLAGISFRRNNFRGRDRILSLDTYASTFDSDAYEARTVALVGSYERKSTLLFQKAIGWSFGFEVLATQERPATVDGVVRERETYLVGALPAAVFIDRTDDLLDPTEGFRLSASISPEISRSDGEQSYYARTEVEGSYYQQVTDKVVLAGRAMVGSIPGTDLENIAPSRRKYAGGGGSVRGYGYQEIGPRNEFDEPSGGRSVVELSAEARIKTGFFDGALSIVPFVDVGSVSTSVVPDFSEYRIGAGLGVRYNTGFGPIRVDVGVPLNPGPDDNPVAVYVSLGQAF